MSYLLQNPNKVDAVKADIDVSLFLQLEGVAVDEWRRSAAAAVVSSLAPAAMDPG